MPRLPHKKLISAVLCLLGTACMASAVVLVVRDRVGIPKPPPGALHSSAAPSSVRPAQNVVNAYSVAPDLPKYISIPAIGVAKARVVRLGVMKDSAIATPDNIFDTGWYSGSAKPGQPGAMFIYGHVSSWTASGVFYDLHKLRPDDAIIITRGDNTVFSYRVVTSKVYPYTDVDMSQVLSPVDAGKPGLNLMTCTGDVIKGTSDFSERLVVFAVQNPA
ncbi:MAG TPA: class F sortase [Candidatus Saccharimonadales bacterium]|nr:class F sortase [Candidatus Saccharimonadales bacterium]